MPNIQFNYQYRDAHGSKRCREVIFGNPDSLELEQIQLKLEQAFWETEFFIAQQIRIPEAFLYLDGSLDANIDHCFHHLDSLTITSCPPTDTYGRSIREFVEEVAHEASLGWKFFDPVQVFGK